MAGVSKRLLKNASMLLLFMFFINHGLLDMLNKDYERSRAFETKIYNTEVYLMNKGLLLISFKNYFISISSLLITTLGLAMCLSALGFLFFEQHKKRVLFIQILIVIMSIDAILLHNPFIENASMFATEIKHFLLDFLIIFSLFMVAGFRDEI